MGIYSSRNSPATEHFIHEALKYCGSKQKSPSIMHYNLSNAGGLDLFYNEILLEKEA
jgi:hypothetical protein